MPTIDNELIMRGSGAGNLTTTANLASEDIKKTGFHGMSVQVMVPSVSGTTPTLDVDVQESADDTNWSTIASSPQITAAGEYIISFATDKRYVRVALTVGGSSPNFGVTLVNLVLQHAYDWGRGVSWL